MFIVNRAIWCLIIITHQFSFSLTAPIDTGADELIFAHVIYRHGNRTIFRTHKNDPYKNASYWPEGFGALTNVGKHVQYELGKYLRRRYFKLIGTGSPDKAYIRSTDTDRSIMSALCNAAGLFSPSPEQLWEKSINWQPVPVHTVPLNEDYLVYQSIPCDKIDQLYDKYMESNETKALLGKHSELREYIRKHSGSSIEAMVDFFQFYDAFHIQYLRGLRLSKWAKKVLKSSNGTLEYLTAINFVAFTHTTEMKKAKAGFLIKEIFERFKNKTRSLLEPDRSLWIYSAHDNTIINVLNALNVYEYHMPPFAASVHFELYKDDRDYYVQLFYRTDKSEYIPPIDIPNCGIKCPLNKLFTIFADILPTENENYASLCRLST